MDYKARSYSPYINRFLQSDSTVVDIGNPQSWNRYSYVANRPVNFNDPSGHRPCGDGERHNCNRTINTATDQPTMLDSMVYLVFGRPGEGNNTMGIDDTPGRSSIGQGVIIKDKWTIITADHVYEGGAEASATNLWVQVDESDWIKYDMDDLKIEYGPGDTAIISLPHMLTGDVKVAEANWDYQVTSGQSLVATYAEPIRNDEQKLTGFSQHMATTQYYLHVLFRSPDVLYSRYGEQPLLKNPGHNLNRGDSGGGVFYNNQLVAVNSSVSPNGSWVAIAPLCLMVSGNGSQVPC